MTEVSIGIAFIAGLVSFLSPCVLPIIPGFLAYLAGSAGSSHAGSEGSPRPSRFSIFISSVFFVLGFSVIFAILGVLLNTVLVHAASAVQTWLSRAGGLVIIFFGLYLTGLLKISFLDQKHGLAVKYKFNSKHVTSFVFGAAFAAGWTPCVGAALGAIIGLASAQPTNAFVLLMSYALGLGLPFLVVGLFAGQAGKLIERSGKLLHYVNVAFGVVLVLLGILVFTESLSVVANLSLLNSVLLK